MGGKERVVHIPDDLYKAVEGNLSRLGAGSVEEYLIALLEDDLRRRGILPAYSPEEERALEEHLRDLGYID